MNATPPERYSSNNADFGPQFIYINETEFYKLSTIKKGEV